MVQQVSRTDRKMEPTWTKNGAKIESTGDKLRANSAKSNFWNTRFYKTKLADLLPKSTPQPRGITIKFKCDFDCTFLTSLARTRRRVLLLASGLWPLASGLWPGLGGTRVALKSAAALRACRRVGTEGVFVPREGPNSVCPKRPYIRVF